MELIKEGKVLERGEFQAKCTYLVLAMSSFAF